MDLDRGLLWVRRSYSKGRMGTPKGGKTRSVDMSRQLQVVLRAYMGATTIEATVQGKLPTP